MDIRRETKKGFDQNRYIRASKCAGPRSKLVARVVMADEEDDFKEPAEVPLQWNSRKTRSCIVCHLIKTEEQVNMQSILSRLG